MNIDDQLLVELSYCLYFCLNWRRGSLESSDQWAKQALKDLREMEHNRGMRELDRLLNRHVLV